MQDMGLNPEALERTKLVQLAMGQFEQRHGPYKNVSEDIVCQHCSEDWPCQKMELMMLIQGFASLQAMMPSGNMGNLLSRFGGGGR